MRLVCVQGLALLIIVVAMKSVSSTNAERLIEKVEFLSKQSQLKNQPPAKFTSLFKSQAKAIAGDITNAVINSSSRNAETNAGLLASIPFFTDLDKLLKRLQGESLLDSKARYVDQKIDDLLLGLRLSIEIPRNQKKAATSSS